MARGTPLPQIGDRYDGRQMGQFVRVLQDRLAVIEQPATVGWTTANYTPTRTLNAGTATTADVANVLCTLIEDLKAAGRLGA